MSGSLIFTFTISLAYRSGKNNYKGCLFAYACTIQWMKYQLFLGKYCLKVVKCKCEY